MKIQFGRQPAVDVKSKRAEHAQRNKTVKDQGVELNAHTVYSGDVKFENIVPAVNVTKVKGDADGPTSGIAKGMLMAEVPVTVPKNTAAATMEAMKKRCDYKPALENIDLFELGHKRLMEKIPQFPEIRVDQELMTEWLSKQLPAKAERMREAILSSEWRFDGDTKHVFAKQEALLKEHRAQPRVVYQGTDMYNMVTGAVVMELNRRMKWSCSKQNPKNTGNVVIYACGSSGEELGEIMDGARGEYIESDAKNNDGSQSKEFRKYEALWYKRHGAPMWFVREFARNTSVTVWTRYGVKARVDGQRWSGESTTTTGNSYVHMALMQAAADRAAVSDSTHIHGGDDFLGIVDGDPKMMEEAITHTYKRSGMVAEVLHQRVPNRATFYRKRYVRSSQGTLPVPQFGRVLSKINLRANSNTEIDDASYMAGKYLSAAYEHRHVPMIKDVLLQTSATLSSKPHLDKDMMRIVGTNVEEVKEKVGAARVIPAEELDTFLHSVYGVGVTTYALAEMYNEFATSALDYVQGWTYVDSRTKKTVNKKANWRYQPHYKDSPEARALRLLDV